MKRSVARALAPPTVCTSFVDPFVAIYDRNRRMIVALWGPVWVEPILQDLDMGHRQLMPLKI